MLLFLLSTAVPQQLKLLNITRILNMSSAALESSEQMHYTTAAHLEKGKSENDGAVRDCPRAVSLT